MDALVKILVEASKGTKKTYMLYRCNLSHRQLHVYVRLLHDLGFWTSHVNNGDSGLKDFRTAPKWLEFLDTYRIIKSLML